MKFPKLLIIFLIVAFAIYACRPVTQTMHPPEISMTPLLLTFTPAFNKTFTPLPTKTETPINTMTPKETSETIRMLLKDNNDCSAPCFWGITPGKTSIEEAKSIFNHLGLQIASITFEGTDFSEISYDLDNNLSINISLSTKENIVENISIHVNTNLQKTGISREWLAYSPDTLIKRYGTPSRIDFGADWGPRSFFSMQMYFENIDLIVQYTGEDLIPNKKGSSQVCPLTAEFETIWLWSGKNPVYPPGEGISVNIATPLTTAEFAQLMTGDPNMACFLFKGDVFP